MEPTALEVESCCVRRLCSTTPDAPVGARVSDGVSTPCLADSLAVIHWESDGVSHSHSKHTAILVHATLVTLYTRPHQTSWSCVRNSSCLTLWRAGGDTAERGANADSLRTVETATGLPTLPRFCSAMQVTAPWCASITCFGLFIERSSYTYILPREWYIQ